MRTYNVEEKFMNCLGLALALLLILFAAIGMFAVAFYLMR
jgi:hypothetical protein